MIIHWLSTVSAIFTSQTYGNFCKTFLKFLPNFFAHCIYNMEIFKSKSIWRSQPAFAKFIENKRQIHTTYPIIRILSLSLSPSQRLSLPLPPAEWNKFIQFRERETRGRSLALFPTIYERAPTNLFLSLSLSIPRWIYLKAQDKAKSKKPGEQASERERENL